MGAGSRSRAGGRHRAGGLRPLRLGEPLRPRRGPLRLRLEPDVRHRALHADVREPLEPRPGQPGQRRHVEQVRVDRVRALPQADAQPQEQPGDARPGAADQHAARIRRREHLSDDRARCGRPVRPEALSGLPRTAEPAPRSVAAEDAHRSHRTARRHPECHGTEPERSAAAAEGSEQSCARNGPGPQPLHPESRAAGTHGRLRFLRPELHPGAAAVESRRQPGADGRAEGGLPRHRHARRQALPPARQADHRLGQDRAVPHRGPVQSLRLRAHHPAEPRGVAHPALVGARDLLLLRRGPSGGRASRARHEPRPLPAQRRGQVRRAVHGVAGVRQDLRALHPRPAGRRPRRRAAPGGLLGEFSRPRVRGPSRVPLGPLQLRPHRLLRLQRLPVPRQVQRVLAQGRPGDRQAARHGRQSPDAGERAGQASGRAPALRRLLLLHQGARRRDPAGALRQLPAGSSQLGGARGHLRRLLPHDAPGPRPRARRQRLRHCGPAESRARRDHHPDGAEPRRRRRAPGLARNRQPRRVSDPGAAGAARLRPLLPHQLRRAGHRSLQRRGQRPATGVPAVRGRRSGRHAIPGAASGSRRDALRGRTGRDDPGGPHHLRSGLGSGAGRLRRKRRRHHGRSRGRRARAGERRALRPAGRPAEAEPLPAGLHQRDADALDELRIPDCRLRSAEPGRLRRRASR